MGLFEDVAERSCSDGLADLMARILAGEIRRPKSVSRRTLQVAAILDEEVVNALAAVAPYVLDTGWFHVPPSRATDWREHFRLLSSVSISNEVGVRKIRFNSSNRSAIRIGSKGILLTQHPQNFTWFSDGVELTPIGNELIRLLPVQDERRVLDIARGFKEHDQIQKVEMGDIVEGDGIGLEGLVEVT